MIRREFFEKLAAFAACLGFGVKEVIDPPSYTYDWQKEETDDPRFKTRPMVYGRKDKHQLFLQVGDRSQPEHPIHDHFRPVRAKTGKDGWIEGYWKAPGEAVPIDHVRGCVRTVTYLGRVRYEVYV